MGLPMTQQLFSQRCTQAWAKFSPPTLGHIFNLDGDHSSGAKIVGETWSQLVASGSYFSVRDVSPFTLPAGKHSSSVSIYSFIAGYIL